MAGFDDYYKKSNAPRTTYADAALALGSAPINLTSLILGTTYDYGIYEDSSCATELADATFAAASELYVESLSQNAATWRLAGHSGSWHCKANAAPDNPARAQCRKGAHRRFCGLTPGETYACTAYDDSARSTPVAAVTFTTGPYVSNLYFASDQSLTVSHAGSSVAIGFRTGDKASRSTPLHMPTGQSSYQRRGRECNAMRRILRIIG